MNGRFALALRIAGRIALAVGLFAGTLMLPNHHDVAQAAGIGPGIGLGTASGTTVPVNATTASADPYEGFNLYISLRASAGITMLSVKGDASGTTLPAPFSCPESVSISVGSPVQTKAAFLCVTQSVAPTGTRASGLLASFILNAQGNGCIVVALPSPGRPLLDTFTINDADDGPGQPPPQAQSNAVDTTTTRNVLVGTGSVENCSEAKSPSPTPTCFAFAPPPSAPATVTPVQGTKTPSAAASGTATVTPVQRTTTPSAAASGTATATPSAPRGCIAGPDRGGCEPSCLEFIQTFNGPRPLLSGALPPAGTGPSTGRHGDLAGILVGVGLTALLSGMNLRRRRKAT